MFKLIGAKKAPYDADGRDEVIKEYLCDTDADFATLPESDPGSMAVSIESGKVYVVNTAGAWVEFAASAGAAGPEPIKMFKTITYADGTLNDLCALGGATVVNTSNAAILPTKTTDGVLESDGQNNMHFYYIEDENDIFLYVDMAGTGTPDWVSMGAMDASMSFKGAIEDISEATEEGYYALIYYVEPGKNFTVVGYDPATEAVISVVPHLMSEMEATCVFEETVLPTKTTDGIKLSDVSTGIVYLYYIEDENVVAFCAVNPSTGETMWGTLDELTGSVPCLGIITDKSEATDPNGYYVLMY